jgi:hypothetical protein
MRPTRLALHCTGERDSGTSGSRTGCRCRSGTWGRNFAWRYHNLPGPELWREIQPGLTGLQHNLHSTRTSRSWDRRPCAAPLSSAGLRTPSWSRASATAWACARALRRWASSRMGRRPSQFVCAEPVHTRRSLTVLRHVHSQQGCLHCPEWKREVGSHAMCEVHG